MFLTCLICNRVYTCGHYNSVPKLPDAQRHQMISYVVNLKISYHNPNIKTPDENRQSDV